MTLPYSFTNLTDGQTYYFSVSAYDTSGNESCFSDQVSKTIAITDTTPPVISSVSVSNIISFIATVTWTTSEPADGQLEFGTIACPCHNTTPVVPDLLTAHVINLSGLAPNTTYYYRVKSKDASGNLSASATYSFKTATP